MNVKVLIKSIEKPTTYKYGKEVITVDYATLNGLMSLTTQIFTMNERITLYEPVMNGVKIEQIETNHIINYVWYVDYMPNMRDLGNLLK